MTITEQIFYLSSWEYWLLTALGLAAAGAAFYFAFLFLARARTIEDMPTTRIRFAQQGYVELKGTAHQLGPKPVRAPLTETDCCWYRYRIEKKGHKNWRVLENEESGSAFVLRDITGDCRVDPAGAEVSTDHRRVWYGRSKRPQLQFRNSDEEATSLIRRVAKILTTEIVPSRRYRYTEECIFSGDPLYAIGSFRTFDEIDHQRERQSHLRRLLREWKGDQNDLLARFDGNRDGRLDQAEWQRARQAATRQIEREHRQHLATRIEHSLSDSGCDNRPYLISTQPQFSLVKRYRIKAGMAIVLFFLAGGVSFWLLGNH